MEDGLLRQRRNLMVTCCLLFLLSASGVSVEKVGLAGFEMKFERPAALFLALWLAFFYYLYRYYVYFRASGLESLKVAFTEPFLNELRNLALVKLLAEFGDKASFTRTLDWQVAWASKPSLDVRVIDGQDAIGQQIVRDQSFALPFSTWSRVRLLLQHWGPAIWNDKALTDYLFPFLLAIFTFAYAGLRNWQGSFSQIALAW